MKAVNGEGTVKKRTIKRKDGSSYKRYYARVTTGIDPVTGKQKRVDGPLRETSKEANQDRRQMLEHLQRGVSDINMSVGDYLDYWIEHHEHELRPRSIQAYKGDIKNHLKPRIGKIGLGDLSPTDIQTLQTDLMAKPHVARKVRKCLSAALTQAVRWQILPSNPIHAVKAPKKPDSKHKIWEQDEVKRFLDTAKDHKLYPAYYLMLNLGLRVGELRGLKWSDIDGNTIHIQRGLSGDKKLSNPEFGPLKTQRSDRWLPLPPDVLMVLAHHRQAQDKARADARWNELGLIITTTLGTAPSLVRLTKPFKALCKKAEVRTIRIHDLRHTAASLWIAAGMDVQTVAARLGHADSSITHRTYLHAFEAKIKRSALSMEELLNAK